MVILAIAEYEYEYEYGAESVESSLAGVLKRGRISQMFEATMFISDCVMMSSDLNPWA